MVKVYDVEEIKSRLTPVFDANGVRSAVLFGSYAKGLATEKSDVDIFVDSGLRGLDLVGLAETLSETLDRDVDLIDVIYVKKGSMIEDEVRETGIRIYVGDKI
jgi:uncharacterized protein